MVGSLNSDPHNGNSLPKAFPCPQLIVSLWLMWAEGYGEEDPRNDLQAMRPPTYPLRFLRPRLFHSDLPGLGGWEQQQEPAFGALGKTEKQLTRIQIRKAQSWGCLGNLQQAPSLALRVAGVGAQTCQAGSALS